MPRIITVTDDDLSVEARIHIDKDDTTGETRRQEALHGGGGGITSFPDEVHISPNISRRQLLEIKAKRAIVSHASSTFDMEAEGVKGPEMLFRGASNAYQSTLRWMSLPYADHPEYRQEWAP